MTYNIIVYIKINMKGTNKLFNDLYYFDGYI